MQGTDLVGHHGHTLCKAAGGYGLVQLLMLGSNVGNHDSAAVAPQAVAQHLGHHGVPVGHMGPLLPHAALLQQGRGPHWGQQRIETGVETGGQTGGEAGG